LNVHLKQGEAVNLSADLHYPVNLGMACPKGWEALTPLKAPDRGTTPLIRDSNGVHRATKWHEAMSLFCERMKGIQQKHGPHSIAFLSSGQICTEEMALLGSLFKFGMGGLHCDSNTRQCMATTHTAYKQSFGFDAPPFTYADFEESDVLVFVGANPCIAHPIMWQRVMRNRHKPEIVVIDPRTTETAMAATQHYAVRPKSDLVFLYGIANGLIARNAIDPAFVEAHTADFDGFAEFVSRFPPKVVSRETGIAPKELDRLCATIATGKRVSFWWTMGVNQGHEATRTAQAIINLALMTGNIGRPGTGANSITGQCNAMGSRLFSNITGLIGGHDFSKADHRRKVSQVLEIPEDSIPSNASLPYHQILNGVSERQIRGLWIIGTNTAHSWVDQKALRDCLGKLEFLVVQDMYPTTETAQLAHLYFPAAGWGEKEGTIINSERRIGLVKKVSRAPGVALSDFAIFKLVAEYWGCGELFRKWTSPEAAFHLLKEISRGQPCDITGIRNYQILDQAGGIQWPWPEKAAGSGESPQPERRLFADGRFYTSDARARFLFSVPRPVSEPTDSEYPFVLLTGRGTSAQWHTGTRTNKSAVLLALSPKSCYIEINPSDAASLKIKSQDHLTIQSRRAQIRATAFITSTVRRGEVFIPMHYPEVNQLTNASFDPHSSQPSYKYCAVRLIRS